MHSPESRSTDAFTDHLREYPCHVLRPGRGFDRAKRITIATLQTRIAEYGRLSSGYFDLVIADECHRSIYGRWSGALRHFDGIQLGLTATPCTARPQLDFEADAARVADLEDGHFVHDTLRFFEVERPTFRYELQRAIAEGYLAPYRIYRAMTVKTAAEGGFEAWLGEQSFGAEQARWAGLIGSRIRADAMTTVGFWDYDLDSHPFAGLGGYDQAVRIFGGRDALDLVLGSLNVAVFDDNGPHLPARADDRPAIQDSNDPCH